MNYKTHQVTSVCVGLVTIASINDTQTKSSELWQLILIYGACFILTIGVGAIIKWLLGLRRNALGKLLFILAIGIVPVLLTRVVCGIVNPELWQRAPGWGVFIWGCWLGSLFPDIDNPHSKFGSAVYPVSKAIQKSAGHRGTFHSPMLYIVMYAVAVVAFRYTISSFSVEWINIELIKLLGIGFVVGNLAHILADTFNKKGIPLLYPFSKKTFRIIGFKMGGINEFIFTVVFVICSLSYVYLMTMKA